MGDDVDVVRRLLDRADWHEGEARRIRDAAEIVAAELGVTATKSRTRKSRQTGANTIPGMIVAVLDTEPREWTLAEIKDALIERGLNANDDNVRTASRRLHQRNEITKIRTGVYRSNNAVVPVAATNANDSGFPESFGSIPRPLQAVAAVGGAVTPPH